jgi:RNA polymerase sigma-70 factor, ECF subfamily
MYTASTSAVVAFEHALSIFDGLYRQVDVSTEQRPMPSVPLAIAEGQVREPASSTARQEAFQRLADGSLTASYRLANAILADPVESRDAVHDAVVTAWKSWDSLRDQTRFDAWFQRIVVNTCRDRLRRAARRRTERLAALPEPIGPDVAADIHRRLLVEQALRRLAPDDRIVIALRHYHDLTIEHIAGLLGLPTSTTNSRLRTARSRLREAIRSIEDGSRRDG